MAKLGKNNRLKAFLRAFLLGVMVLYLLILPVSAWEFDNYKDYDPVEKIITISEWELFTPDYVIAELKLLTPQYNPVSIGEDVKVAEINLISHVDYDNALSDIDFFKVIGLKKLDKDYKIKYSIPKLEDVEVLDSNCYYIKSINGSDIQTCDYFTKIEKEYIDYWHEFDDFKLLKGEYKLGIFTDVDKGDYIEWIPKDWFGIDIYEWASYEATELKYVATSSTSASVNSLGGQEGVAYNWTANFTGAVQIVQGYLAAEPVASDQYRSMGLFSGNTEPTTQVGVWSDIQHLTAVGYYNWTFPDNDSNVEDGTNYWLVFNNTGGAIAGYFRWGEDISGGKNYYVTDWATWTPFDSTVTHINLKIYGADLIPVSVGTSLSFPVEGYNISTLEQTFIVNSSASNLDLGNTTLYIYQSDGDMYCRQEWANKSETCGALSTGIYSFSNALNDGNWNTEQDSYGDWFMNYTKPNGALNTSVWEVKDGDARVNVSLPSSCWSNNPLQFRVEYGVVCGGKCSRWSCYGGGWNSLRELSALVPYEEAMNWETPIHQETNSSYNSLNQTTFNYIFTEAGDYLWNALTLDSTGAYSDWDANRTISLEKLTEDGESYSPSTTEGSTEYFELNISTLNFQVSSAILTYNHTNYTGSYIDLGSYDYKLSRTLNIPTTNTEINNSFFWNIRLSDNSGHLSTEHNQTVYSFNIDNCTVYNYTLFNLTMYDEDLQNQLDGNADNTTIKFEFQLKSLDNSITLYNYSKSFNHINPARVCHGEFFSNNSYRLDGVIEYSSLRRFTEFYNFQNFTVTNSTLTHINLYDLNSSKGQGFRIVYKDENFVEMIDAILDIQRKYIGEGVFKTVEMSKTSNEGFGVGHLIPHDVIYNIIIKKNGQILATFENILAECQNPALQTCQINLNSYGSSTLPTDFVNTEGVDFTLTYNTTTKEIKSIFTTTNSIPSTMSLNVTLYDTLGTTAVCNDQLYSAGGQLTCSIPSSFGNATVIAKVLKDDSEIGRAMIKVKQSPSDLYGSNLILLAMIIFLTFVGFGATSDNPMVMGIFMVLGSIVLIGLNFIYSPSILGVGATILWFIVSIVIVLIKGSNRT